MDKEKYCEAIGFVATYKSLDEVLLFNELNERLNGIELEGRGKSSAAFGVKDYSAVVEEIH